MKELKKLVLTLLTFITLIILVFQFRSEIIRAFSYSRCGKPISYKLGSLDPKFGLDRTTVTADVQSAVEIWNKTYGKPLFIDSPEAVVTVNFVYDQRSALNTNIDQLQNQLDQKSFSLQQQINSYESDLSSFEQKLADFNALISQVNKSGGATPDAYKKLIVQQNKLNSEGDSLNALARQLNLVTNNFNSKVQTLNQNVDQFNQIISQKPEEGLYDENDNTITIYFVANHDELIHTLAHEFGHALGMQHTDDSQSIMYPYTSSFLTVTLQDKQQLDDACRVQPFLTELWVKKLVAWFQTSLRF